MKTPCIGCSGTLKGPIVVQRRLYSCRQTAVNNDLGVDRFSASGRTRALLDAAHDVGVVSTDQLGSNLIKPLR
jgi:hypothetical protein